LRGKTSILLCFLLLTLMFPLEAFSFDMSGHSRSFLSARKTVFDENIFRFYEYVDVSFANLGKKNISVHTSGWVRYDIDGPAQGDGEEGELAYAYVVVPVDSINARFNVGRQFVFAGVSSEQLDGVSMTTSLAGFGASLFGGTPTETDFDKRGGDSIYGGRLSHQIKGLYEFGASFLREDNDSSAFRKEYGVDLWVKPAKWLSFNGMSSYNEITSGWMEQTYRLSAQKGSKLQMYAEYSMIDYEHYFSAETVSAFSSPFVNTMESSTSSGLGLELSLTDSMRLSARYSIMGFDLAGDASLMGAGIDYAKGKKTAGVSIDRMAGETTDLKYTHFRTYASTNWKKTDITLDLSMVDYDAKIGSVDQTVTLTSAFGYSWKKNLSSSLEFAYEENALSSNETRGLLKIDYRFGAI